jgi:hypothetical protein
LDRELQDYYENRFTTMSTQGWKDLIEDVQKIYDTTNQISSTDNFEGFHKRKGQLDILQWILSLQQVSEQTYEELQDADNA